MSVITSSTRIETESLRNPLCADRIRLLGGVVKRHKQNLAEGAADSRRSPLAAARLAPTIHFPHVIAQPGSCGQDDPPASGHGGSGRHRRGSSPAYLFSACLTPCSVFLQRCGMKKCYAA